MENNVEAIFQKIDTTKISILCKSNDKMELIINKYCTKALKQKDNCIFKYNSVTIKNDVTFWELANEIDKEKKAITIDVFDNELNQNNFSSNGVQVSNSEENKKESNSLSKEPELPKSNNYENIKENILNKNDNNNNNFNKDKLFLFQIKKDDDKLKRITQLMKKKNICKEDSNEQNPAIEPFTSYCKDCRKNLCTLCESKHEGHNIERFKYLKTNKALNEILDNYKKDIDNLSKLKDVIFGLINNCMDIFKFGLNIHKEILDNYSLDNKSYEILQISNKIYHNKSIFEDDNIKKDKFEKLLKKFQKELFDIVNNKEEEGSDNKNYQCCNEVTMIYKVTEKDKLSGNINIFGKDFINNNKDINKEKCFLICDEKKFKLTDTFELKQAKEIDSLKITLKGINEIKNPSYMFYECPLFSIKDFNNYKTSYVTDMSYMFYGCDLLQTLNGMSEWDTSHTTNMSYMFHGCKSLQKLPDISKWKTKNVSSLSHMFCDCESLIELPDISNWITNKVFDVRKMFCNCKKIQYMPNLSNWNMDNAENLSSLFSGCKSLKFLPDISNWKLTNAKDLRNFFKNCELLEEIPDISKWDISKAKKMNSFFEGCRKLKVIPDISGWETKNVTDISGFFKDCISLEEICDISKWQTLNIENMSYLFSGCENLLEIPNISNWNFKKAKDISFLFNNCINLYSYNDFSYWNIENKRKKGKFTKSPEFPAELFE